MCNHFPTSVRTVACYIQVQCCQPLLRAPELCEVKVEVAVLGSPSLISLMVSVDVKQHVYQSVSELRSCVKVEVAVLGSPSLISLMVSVDAKQH